MRLRLQALLLAAVAWLLLLAGTAGAHAVVFPRQVTANAFEKFTLRVPTEKPQPTVKVKLAVPGGVTIGAIKPLPGWKYEVEKSPAGVITAITWSGGEIGAGEFMEFDLSGRAPKEPGQLAWKAWQTYQDGTVVAWEGPSDSQTPASVMEVRPAPAAAPTPPAGAHDTGAAPAAPAPGPAAPAGAAPAQGAPAAAPAPGAAPATAALPLATTYAAWGALALSAAALAVALVRRKG